MNDIKCECKDNRIYYVLAGGGLVLLTYLVKNNKSYQQQLHSQTSNQEQTYNSQKVNELENQIHKLREQLDDQTDSIQRYLQYKNSKPSQPKGMTVQQMNNKAEDAKRRHMFNMI